MHLDLSSHEPTLVNPQDIGHLDTTKISCLIVLASTPIITSGNNTRLENVLLGISESKKFEQIKVIYIGHKPKFPMPGSIYSTYFIDNSQLILGDERSTIYSYVTEVIGKIEVGATIGFLSTFQSANDLILAKEAIKVRRDLKGVFIGCESSFAYTNEPGEVTLKVRRTADIAGRHKYTSNDQITTYLLRPSTPYIPIDKVVTHPPMSTYSLATSTPMSNKVKESLLKLRNKSCSEIKKDTLAILKRHGCDVLHQALEDPKTLLIHLAINDGCFDKNKVGFWWTAAQYADILSSSRKLVDALTLVAKENNLRLVLTSRRKFVDYISIINNPNILCNHIGDGLSDGTLYLADLPDLSTYDHIQYMALSEITIHRTIQANTYTEAIYAGVTNIIYTIPGKGYMDAEAMDSAVAQKYNLSHFTSYTEKETIVHTITKILKDKPTQQKLKIAQDMALSDTINNPNISYFEVVSFLFGL